IFLKKRETPHSKLLVYPRPGAGFGRGGPPMRAMARDGAPAPDHAVPAPPPVRVLEAGVVGSLDYKVLEADRADALFDWLKEHKYQYAGDEASLDYYVKKQACFTVMKIDTMAM